MAITINRRNFLSSALLLGVAATVTSTLPGCSKSEDANTPLEFQGWDFQPDTIETLIKQWSEKSGVEVNVSISPNAGYPATIQTRMQSGGDIDVFYNNSFNGKKFYEAEWADNLSDLPQADEVLSAMFESARPMYQAADGSLIALPYYSALHYIMYNPVLMKEAGIDQFPTSFDELYSACEKMKKDGICDTPYQGYWAKDAIEEWFISYLLNAGVTPFDGNGDPVFADDSKSVEMMSWWLSTFKEGLTPASTLTDDPGKLTSNLADGVTCFFDAHHYFLPIAKAEKGKYAADLLETSSGFGVNKTLQAGEILQMGKISNADRREKAWDLLKFYGFKDENGKFPAFNEWAKAAGLLAPYPEFFDDEEIAQVMSEHYDFADLRATFENQSDPVPTRFEPWYPDFGNQVADAIQDMLVNNAEPKATIQKLADAAVAAKNG